MKLPQCVLFDLDGTLLDSLPSIAFSIRETCSAVGLPDRDLEMRRFIGPPIRKIFSRLLGVEDPEVLDSLEVAFRQSYDSEGWRKAACFDGATEVLKLMRTCGHRLFVVTNKPRHISLRILEREDVLSLFDAIYTRDSREPAFVSKEEMVRVLLKEQGLASSNCIMVGDTMEDVTAAHAIGMNAVFMEHGYGEISPAYPVRFKARNFSDFLPLLASEK